MIEKYGYQIGGSMNKCKHNISDLRIEDQIITCIRCKKIVGKIISSKNKYENR